jgi:hypothetical protein
VLPDSSPEPGPFRTLESGAFFEKPTFQFYAPTNDPGTLFLILHLLGGFCMNLFPQQNWFCFPKNIVENMDAFSGGELKVLLCLLYYYSTTPEIQKEQLLKMTALDTTDLLIALEKLVEKRTVYVKNRGNDFLYGIFWEGTTEEKCTAPILIPEKETFVYLISDTKKTTLKIGITKNITARLAQLQKPNPHILKIIACTKGDEEDEKFLHALFDKYRIHGEWFRITSKKAKGILQEVQTRFEIRNTQ